MKKKLLPWQENGLQAWEANHFRGIVHVVTGAGKTVFAIAALRRLFDGVGGDVKVKIVVPKTFLMYQWHTALLEELAIGREHIGFFSGAHKSSPDKQIMLYVVNSARDVLARHIADDVNNGHTVFLIADECHHYGSEANARIFGYIPYLPQGGKVYTLGLSATPRCANYNEVLIPALGDEVYRFGFFTAINADVISKFTLFNIAIPFSPEERLAYDELSEHIGYTLYKLNEICPHFGRGKKSSAAFFYALEAIMRQGEPEAADLAKTAMYLFMQRKEVAYRAKYRTDAVIELVRRIPKSSKILIFSERIETAGEIHGRLCALYPNEAGLYHSKVPKHMGVNTLRQFEAGDIRILVSCKTLDEGLNIAAADTGIVASSTGSRRQRIQRLGRVLRKKPDGHHAYFFYLYVGGTAEEEELLGEIARPEFDRLINRIDLYYCEESGTFMNPQYSAWEATAIEQLAQKHCSDEEMVEFMRNADRGLITDDWLAAEDECLRKLETAQRKEERNYYIAMLLIIRARNA